MAGWLSSAASVFGGAAKPVPQAFSIRCSCGGKVTGFRDDKARILPCPGCRQSMLVLPATPYPIPKRSAPPPPRPRPSSEDDAAPSESRDSVTPLVEKPLKKSLRKRGKTPSESPVAETTSTPNESLGITARSLNPITGDPPQSRREARQAAMAATWSAVRRRLGQVFTPVRLIALVTVTLIGLTGYALRQRELFRQLDQTVTETTKQAELAVKDRNWRSAAESYRTVADALDRMGRDDPPARRLRQWHRELSAVTMPLPRSLPDLVTEAASESRVSSDLDWATLFLASYGDGWLVTEVWLDPGVDGGHPRVEVPLLAGQFRATLVGEVPQARIIPTNRLPARVLLATRLSAIERKSLDGDFTPVVTPPAAGAAEAGPPAAAPDASSSNGHDDAEWVIRLNSESAFLWARIETLTETGLVLSDDERAAAILLLKDQAEWLGVSE